MGFAKATYLLVLILLSIGNPLYNIYVSGNEEEPLYLAIVWHQHQPFYEDLNGSCWMPWLRLHAAKDYFKMAWLSKLYPDIHVTIDLTGSLLIQLRDLVSGKCIDKQYRISLKIARGEELTIDDKWSMLQVPGGFFDINWNTVVYKYARYKELLDKRNNLFNKYKGYPLSERKKLITEAFSLQDYIDLATMFNLYWMNPLVIENLYPELHNIWDKGKYSSSDPNYTPFTREDLWLVLEAHIDQARRALEIHRELALNGTIEVITTPYTHPLSPLLVDLGWEDDLRLHMTKSIELYRELFNTTLRGLWPPEEAVNEGALRVFSEYNISWVITDPRVAAYADPEFVVGNMPNYNKITLPYYVRVGNRGIYVFLRDWVLSDKVGFQYSSWSPSDTVNDFISTVLSVKTRVGGGRIFVVALDGENAWDSYPDDASDFLVKLYQKLHELQEQGVIRTVTLSEYLYRYGGISKAIEFPRKLVTVLDLENRDLRIYTSYTQLPRKTIEQSFPEGSWAGGSLDLWIGERQENYAWYLLNITRSTLLRYVRDHGWSWLNPLEWDDSAREALEYLLRAEGSDWYWGYGSNIEGSYDYVGDMLVKLYLGQVYALLGLEKPGFTLSKCYPDGTPYGTATPYSKPSGTGVFSVDGVLTEQEAMYTYTYLGSILSRLHVGVDYGGIYIGIIGNNTLSYIIDLFIGGSHNFSYLDMNSYDAGMGVSFTIIGGKVYRYINGSWTLSTDKINYTLGDNVAEYYIPYSLLEISKPATIYIRVIGTYNNETIYMPEDYPVAITSKHSIEGNLVFSYSDPQGDDHGPGSYKYPLNNVFKPGAFDLLEFKVYDLEDSICFVFKFRELGDNPWNAPYGFSLQIIEVYIDIKEGGGATWASTGSNVRIAESDAWEIAFRAAGWEYGNVVWFSDKTMVSGILQFMVDEDANAIYVFLPKHIELPNGTIYYIGRPSSGWDYVVLVGSQDGYGIDYWRPVEVSADIWSIGGGDPRAIEAGVAPRAMDMLSPNWTTQESMLSSYDIYSSTLATVYGVPGEPPATNNTTVSQSPTNTSANISLPTPPTTPFTHMTRPPFIVKPVISVSTTASSVGGNVPTKNLLENLLTIGIILIIVLTVLVVILYKKK